MNSNGIKKLFLIIIVIFAISIIGFVVYNFLAKEKSKITEDVDITETASFFLENEDSKYALFNEDGEQLTEFIYTTVYKFVNGTAIVMIDDDYGIIDENGKMTVDFGKYKHISSDGGLYEVLESNESLNKYLINGSGKVLYNLENIEVFSSIDYYSILKDKVKNKYTVVNYKGKEILSFPIVDYGYHISTDGYDYVSIFYNNENFIFNSITGKQIISFESDKHYRVGTVSEDKKIITLYSTDDEQKTYYKFIKDGKLYDLTNQCDKISYEGNLLCIKNSTTYLLDSNLNIGVTKKNIAYIDNENYAIENEDEESVSFYQNGNFVKKVSCRFLWSYNYKENGIFTLGTTNRGDCNIQSGIYEFYKSNGEKAFEKTFLDVGFFDSNGLIKVSEDDTNYYLIDKTGKQVGGIYKDIELQKSSGYKYYVVVKDKLEGIMDKEGNEIIPCEYSDINIVSKKEGYAYITTLDSKIIIYDLEKKKEVLTVDKIPVFTEHYIQLSLNEKTQYYTYGGKLFYEL